MISDIGFQALGGTGNRAQAQHPVAPVDLQQLGDGTQFMGGVLITVTVHILINPVMVRIPSTICILLQQVLTAQVMVVAAGAKNDLSE